MFIMSIFPGVCVQSPNQPNHCERVPFPPFRLFWHHSFLMSTKGAWAFQQKWNVLTPQPHTGPREAGWGTRHCRAPLSGPNLCWASTISSTERKNCLMSPPENRMDMKTISQLQILLDNYISSKTDTSVRYCFLFTQQRREEGNHGSLSHWTSSQGLWFV